MRFAIISDIHMGPEGYLHDDKMKLTRNSERLTREFLERMEQVKPDLVVNLGDTIEDGDPEEDLVNFKRITTMLNELPCPVYHLIGNHELHNLTENKLMELLGYDSLYFSFDHDDYHFIVLFLESTGGKVIIGDEQIEWLRDDLKSTDKSTIVFTHQGLADQDLSDNPWFNKTPDEGLVERREEIRSILSGSGKVLAIFNGHLHWNRVDVHDGIPYITVQSIVERFGEVPAESYAVVDVEPYRIKVSVRGNDTMEFEHSL